MTLRNNSKNAVKNNLFTFASLFLLSSLILCLFFVITPTSSVIFAQDADILYSQPEEDPAVYQVESIPGEITEQTEYPTYSDFTEGNYDLPGASEFQAKILEVNPISDNLGNTTYYIRAEISNGERKGEVIEFEDNNSFNRVLGLIEDGDKVYITSFDYGDYVEYSILDIIRTPSLIWLFLLFAAVALAVAKFKGVKSLFGLFLSYILIFSYTLPAILRGDNELLVTTLTILLAVPINFFVSHGFGKKTQIAALGTLVSLFVSIILAILFIHAAKLTGNGTDEANLISSIYFGQFGQELNMRVLLLAAVIIGTLGVLDDVTVAQVSMVTELKLANAKLSIKELFFRGMKVGRDHITSLVNTLILVYTSASMPLLLLFANGDSSIQAIINSEEIAEEIVKMLISSTGIIIAVPITTILAAYILSDPKTFEKISKAQDAGDGHGHIHAH